MHEVLYRIGLCRASIYNKMADGSFPKPIKLGIHAVGWVESEINAWLEVRIQARQIKNGGAYIGPQLG
jgi:prophage regulatory protein